MIEWRLFHWNIHFKYFEEKDDYVENSSSAVLCQRTFNFELRVNAMAVSWSHSVLAFCIYFLVKYCHISWQNNLKKICRNLVPFSDGIPGDGRGIPYFYLTNLDPTTRNALNDERSSFTICEFPLGACGREDHENLTYTGLTLTGKVCIEKSNMSLTGS